MTPKSAKRFSDQVTRQKKRMTPKSVWRFSDQVMRQRNRMTPTRMAALAKNAGRFSELIMRLMSQLGKA
jgi:hypothetical protein